LVRIILLPLEKEVIMEVLYDTLDDSVVNA